LTVSVWTVNDPREALALAALGVDSLISDAPGEVLAALEASAYRSAGR
jgi:glycerophosphoryl diester phosphodiesterase